VDLFHRSIMSEPIGTHLLPMAYWHDNEPAASFIYFAEERARAMKWSSNRMCGYVLYRIDSANVAGLEQHHTLGFWKTATPVPFADLEVLERRDNPATLPNLPEMLRARAEEHGTL